MSEKMPTFAIQDLRLMRTGLLRGYKNRISREMKVLACDEHDQEFRALYYHLQEVNSEMRKRGL